MPADSKAFKVSFIDVEVDGHLDQNDGWHALQVRWLATHELMGSQTIVVGHSEFPSGAKHALHRHPNAEEWEYVLSGSGIKRIGDQDAPIKAGAIIFTPRNVYHEVANTSSGVIVTLWGYTGAASLRETDYVLPEDDQSPEAREVPGPHAVRPGSNSKGRLCAVRPKNL